jgi:hypothetical protein
MPQRRLPVRPDLDQLKRQAKALLRALHHGDPDAIAEFDAFHPKPPAPVLARLADAQLALARAYQAPSWPRLVAACRLADAIWDDDRAALQGLIARRPELLHEPVLIRESNWGPPLSYAANLGRDEIIETLHKAGADDVAKAFNRAVLQGRIATARKLHAMAGSPPLPDDALHDPAYTLSAEGTDLVLELGGRVIGADGRPLAPVATVLGTDSRNPKARHAILKAYVDHGLELPDTPTMALFRGRIDLLDAHLARDPNLLSRRFGFGEIYPPELGCSQDQVTMTHGSPLDGATLLHLAIDYDELDIARWLIAKGADVNAKARVDADGFGGHTPLFSAVVAQPNVLMNMGYAPMAAPFTELLLAHGADPNARASLRKQMHPGYGPDTLHEYRDVTPLAWGRQFHGRRYVSEPALELIAAAGGRA